jgi:hypothetical protein
MTMRPAPPSSRIAGFVLAAVALAGCDLLSTPGLEDVTLEYIGCTRLPRDTTAAFSVIVRAAGAVVPDPRLDITSSDPSILVVVPPGDSIRSLDQNGTSTLTIRFLSSWFTDSIPTLAQNVQVNPGGGGGGCP